MRDELDRLLASMDSAGGERELRESLLALHDRLAEYFMTRYERRLPFQDMLLDRWELAKSLGFGDGSSIYASSLVFGHVRVGKECWIGPHTILDGSGGLTIGDGVHVSAGTQIYTHDTVKRAVSGGNVEAARSPVVIGNRCYIGPNAVIARGVTIGDGCVIGANAFVNRSLPAGVKAWGTPATIRGDVTPPNGGAAE